MEAIEPYDFKDAVPFQTPYLAGYVADRYDVNMEECMGRATNRIRQSAEDALRETVKGYQTVTTTNRQINIYECAVLVCNVSCLGFEIRPGKEKNIHLP